MSLETISACTQAYLSQKAYKAAVSDLRKAVNLASVEEKPTIQAILDKAQSALPASERSKPVIEMPTSQMPTSVEEPGSPSEKESADGEIEVGYSLEVFMRAELRHSTSNFHARTLLATMQDLAECQSSLLQEYEAADNVQLESNFESTDSFFSSANVKVDFMTCRI